MKQFFILIAVLVVATVRANTQVQLPAEDAALREFLLGAYPELAGRALEIRNAGRWGTKDISLAEVIPTGTMEPLRTPLLDAKVQFSSRQELKQFIAAGPLLHSAENSDLGHAVRDAVRRGKNADAEISQHALPFGPDRRDAVLDRLSGGGLDGTLGVSRVLTVRPASQLNNNDFGFLWTIELETVKSGGAARRYVVQIEPIGGHIVSVTER